MPNFLTAFRIFCAPFLYVCISTASWDWALFLCFLCGFTDYLDGYVARLLKQSSKFGEMFDPVADKIVVSTLYFALYVKNEVPFIFLLVIFLRDIFLVLGSVFILKDQKKIPITPLFLSKINTFLQLFLCFWIFLYQVLKGYNVRYDFFEVFTSTLIYVTLITTVTSGIQYANRFIRFYQ